MKALRAGRYPGGYLISRGPWAVFQVCQPSLQLHPVAAVRG